MALSTNEKVQVLKEKFETYKKDFEEKMKVEFNNLLKEIFESDDRIETVSWIQYTPWFNDGDECVFNWHDDSVGINGYDLWGDELYDLKEGEKTECGFTKDEIENLIDEVRKKLSVVPEEIYKVIFGDHCSVTCKRNGEITIDGYDHD